MSELKKNKIPQQVNRRQAVLATTAAAASLAMGPACKRKQTPAHKIDDSQKAQLMPASSPRMPVAYVPHGGGPYSYVEFGAPKVEVESLLQYWRSLQSIAQQKPKALLIISAHWEEKVPTVMSAERPPMLFDYSGFPEESYKIDWPAPGDPKLARRVQGLLANAGLQHAEDAERGFDHGTFIPFGRSFPKADVPAIQLSLKKGLDPKEHFDLGRALAPLRDEGVLILGSGMSYHNLRAFRSSEANEDAEAFDAWLQDAVLLPKKERETRLTDWTNAPAARRVHPREEHLLPLMVIAGAAGEDKGSIPWSGHVFSKRVSAIHFG